VVLASAAISTKEQFCDLCQRQMAQAFKEVAGIFARQRLYGSPPRFQTRNGRHPDVNRACAALGLDPSNAVDRELLLDILADIVFHKASSTKRRLISNSSCQK
jgi:hypothetical protein